MSPDSLQERLRLAIAKGGGAVHLMQGAYKGTKGTILDTVLRPDGRVALIVAVPGQVLEVVVNPATATMHRDCEH